MSSLLGRNIFKLFSGNIASQVLVFLTVPIVTRLFLPVHFGALQIFESIAVLFLCITGLKYELAIPLGKNQREASASFLLSLLFTGFLTGASAIGVLIGRHSLAQWFQTPELLRFLWLLPLLVALSGFANALNYWASRQGRFGMIAWAGLSSNLGDRLLTILFGALFGGSVLGLFIGRFTGTLVYAGFFGATLGAEIITAIKQARLHADFLWQTARQYKAMPLFKTWDTLLTTISLQMVIFILGHYFPAEVVGHCSLAAKVVMLPITLLGTAIAQVFFPTASQEYRKTGTIAPLVKTMFTKLVQLSAFPMCVLGLFGIALFQSVFGAQWQEAGLYAQLFAAWQLLALLTFPLDIFTLMNRQELGLIFVVMSFIGRVASLLIGVTFGPPAFAIGLFVLFSVCLLATVQIVKFRLAGVSVLWAFSFLLKYLLLCCVLLVPIRLTPWIMERPVLLFLSLSIATLGYGGFLLTKDPSLRQFVITMIPKLRTER